MGSAYLSLGDYQKAIEYCEKGLQISTEIGDQSGIASNNCNLGNVYLCLEEYPKAIECYKKSLQISTEIGDRSGMATNNGNLGNVYLKLGEYQKAIEYFDKGLEISAEIGDRSGIASKNGSLGNAYYKLGEFEKAIEYYEIGLGISTKIGDQSAIASYNGNLGNSYLFLGKFELGKFFLVKSIRLFDDIFLDFVPDENKVEFTQQYFKSHVGLMICFLSMGCTESALLVLDLGRAKELHFCIEKQNHAMKLDMLDYAHAIWDQINAGEEQIQFKELNEILNEGKTETSVLVFTFDVDSFLNVWVCHDRVIFRKLKVTLEAISLLTTLLFTPVNVRVDRNSTFCNPGLATNSSEEVYFPSNLPKQKFVQVGKNAVEGAVGGCSNLMDREILKTLFQILVGSVKDLCKGNKLIIVPDRLLFFTPFCALIDEDGCYLSNSYSIQITPSLHTLKCSMRRSRESKLGFALFVGNPAVGVVSLNGNDFAPSDLPKAAEEVEYLSKLFEAKALLKRKARKDVVLQLLGGASLIHIAAHGEPTRGEIMLAPSSCHGKPCPCISKPESYLLTQRDIMSVSVKARLVVLCCCHTGQGKISSEGVIGITRAFLAAGARSVLATLWPIDDSATKEFMEKFYEELCEETPVCEALKRAMNLFQNHEKEYYRSIKIWAPFTIYGEDVKFQKDEIEEIKEQSRKMFDGFVVM